MKINDEVKTMLETIQYLNQNHTILELFKQGKVSILNRNEEECNLILELFSEKSERMKQDSYLLYWMQ